MYRTLCVMALVTLYAGLAHSFSWEIVTGVRNRLEFIDINGTKTHTENMSSDIIRHTIYDSIHNRILFADNRNLYSFDIATKKTKCLLIRYAKKYANSLAYDPATELLFWVESGEEINSISLKPGLIDSKMNLKRLIWSKEYIFDIAVASCGGFIYWTSYNSVHRARFNGSEREIVIDNVDHVTSITIDQHSQKMYFTVLTGSIKSADLNGKNVRTIFRSTHYIFCLILSKDFIYWQSNGNENEKCYVRQIRKSPPRGTEVGPKLFIARDEYIWEIAANYNIEDITRENQNCDTLKSQLPNNSASTNESLLCVHGTKVSGESRCKCTQGYSGERCDVSVCHNYCLQGDCSASAEGQPKCRCNSGYLGQRCELNACQGYCLHGDCSASADGQPKCRCNAGYSGERCEVHACQGYCLNDGVCSLSEESKPRCRCTGHYEGERCNVPVFDIKCFQAISLLKDIFNTDVISDNGVRSRYTSTAVYRSETVKEFTLTSNTTTTYCSLEQYLTPPDLLMRWPELIVKKTIIHHHYPWQHTHRQSYRIRIDYDSYLSRYLIYEPKKETE